MAAVGDHTPLSGRVLPVAAERAEPRRRAILVAVALASALAAGAPSDAAAYTVKRTDAGAAVRWSVDRVPLALDRSLTEHVGEAHARVALSMAAAAWRGLGGPDLTPTPELVDGERPPGASLVTVPESWPFAPQWLAVTVTTYETTGRILAADVVVNPRIEAALLDEPAHAGAGYDLGAVLTHEMGHVLGLGESSEDPMATMWPRIGRGDTHQRTVEEDDELGVAEAYRGAALHSRAGCGGARVAVRSSRGLLPWVIVALVGGLLAWLSWRQRNQRAALRRGRGRASAAPVGGVVFAAGVLLLWLPPTGASRGEPSRVRAARALSATARPAAERDAVLSSALADPDAVVRRAAVQAVLASPVREDADRVDARVDDADESVARLALRALDAARRAPPARVVPLSDAPAAVREPLRRGTVGRAHLRGTWRDEDGLVHTRVEVGGVAVDVPGGCIGDICQAAGETVVPRDGEMLCVDASSGAWTRWREGVAYGGWLGWGPGVRLVSQASDSQGPDSQRPDSQSPDWQSPDWQSPDSQGPDSQRPDSQRPDSQGPDWQGPDWQGPDWQGPDSQGPDPQGPDSQTRDVPAPVFQTPVAP